MKEWLQNLYLNKSSILEIYTDGSHNSRNLGGIGLFIVDEDIEIEYSHNITKNIIIKDINNVCNHTKNLPNVPKKSDLIIDNIELYAIYQALTKLQYYKKKYDKVIIYTDSDVSFLFINNLNRTKDGKVRQIRNLLSRKLTSLIQSMMIELDFDIEVRSVKSHTNIYGNMRADQLAGKWKKHWKVSNHNNKNKGLSKEFRTTEWENNLLNINMK